jgi:CDP-paratose 2-epimerase
MSILITGGAGFIGSQIAFKLKQKYPLEKIIVFDNLKRRGSELNLPLFKKANIDFVHGDIRNFTDLQSLRRNFEVFIEASAEPSVHAGTEGDPSYLLHTNLVGTLNCLEFARKNCGTMIFLSTSRVYSIQSLKAIPLQETESRFEIDETSTIMSGLSKQGISEEFDTKSFRSLYGASKLGSELVAQEYAQTYKMNILINRCGVIAGPGQWGKVDQGVFTLWVANHFFNKPLSYTGFGGKGKQVRDLIHPDDLYTLINAQLNAANIYSGQVFNVGGGNTASTSLKELTKICRDVTGNQININSIIKTASVDIPYYVTDYRRVSEAFSWKPVRTVINIVHDIYGWLKREENNVRHIF